MDALFRFPQAARRDPAVEAWFAQGDALRLMLYPWFEALRGCGADVTELIHDGHPTACAGGAAFAYVDAFSAHANIGFFCGAFLPDPSRLLAGTGKRMRHVKLRFGVADPGEALIKLIEVAYLDMQQRLTDEA